jgi:hypothetical protein
MSILGTSVAAAVAQTGLQAQQVSRERESVRAQTDRDAQRLQKLIEAHLTALEEDEEIQATDQLRIDSHLPQQQSRDQPKPDRRRPADAPDAGANPAAPPTAAALGEQLYRHVDVQA